MLGSVPLGSLRASRESSSVLERGTEPAASRPRNCDQRQQDFGSIQRREIEKDSISVCCSQSCETVLAVGNSSKDPVSTALRLKQRSRERVLTCTFHNSPSRGCNASNGQRPVARRKRHRSLGRECSWRHSIAHCHWVRDPCFGWSGGVA